MESDFNPVPRKPRPVTEKMVEKDHRLATVAAGGLSRKWVSPGVNGVPDRIDLYGVDRMAVEAEAQGLFLTREDLVRLLAAAITLTELKRPGKKTTPVQESEHARLRALGFTVNVVDQRKTS